MQPHTHPTTAPAPKPRAQGSTLYRRAVDIVRKLGHTNATDLARELNTSQHRARQIIHRMWEEGKLDSQIDMFGECYIKAQSGADSRSGEVVS